jgi:flotillin
MTIEQLNGDREALAGQIRDASREQMESLGLVIDSLQIQQLIDPTNYLETKAAPRIAAVKSEAAIAEAQRHREAEQAQEEANRQVAGYKRDTAIKAAEFKAEQDAAQAKAAQAGPLATAEAEKQTTQKQTELAAIEAERQRAEYVATVNTQADAEKYRRGVEADAEKYARVQAAQAAAEEQKLRGEAEAAAIRAKGEAEAEATKARLLAEADGIRARAEALAAESDAVISQTVAENLPAIVEAAAKAFQGADNLTILNGAQGVSEILTQVIAQAGPVLELARGGGLTKITKAETNGHGTVEREVTTVERSRS